MVVRGCYAGFRQAISLTFVKVCQKFSRPTGVAERRKGRAAALGIREGRERYIWLAQR